MNKLRRSSSDDTREISPRKNKTWTGSNIDKISKLYQDRIAPWLWQNITRFDEFAFEQLINNLTSSDTLLVPWCWDGNMIHILLGHLKKAWIEPEIFWIDISPEAIKLAKQGVSLPRTTFSVGDVLRVKGRFDAAYERNLLHFFITEEERRAYARKIFESLKPWAKYLGLTFDVDNDNCDPSTNLGSSTYFPEWLRYSSQEDLIALFWLFMDEWYIFSAPINIPHLGGNFTRNGLGYIFTRSTHTSILHKISNQYGIESAYENAEFKGVNRVDVPEDCVKGALLRLGIEESVITTLLWKYKHFDFVSMTPGAIITPHNHQTEAFALTISGDGIFAVEQANGKYVKSTPNNGDVVMFHSSKWHAIKATWSEWLLFLAWSVTPIVEHDHVVDLTPIETESIIF